MPGVGITRIGQCAADLNDELTIMLNCMAALEAELVEDDPLRGILGDLMQPVARCNAIAERLMKVGEQERQTRERFNTQISRGLIEDALERPLPKEWEV